MLSLFGRDEYAVLGIAAILDIEKIPYRRVTDLRQAGADDVVVIAGSRLTPEECDEIGRRRSLVLGGAVSPPSDRSCTIDLRQPIWPEDVVRLAFRFGKASLRIPLAPVSEPGGTAGAEVLARFSDGPTIVGPAILHAGDCVWSLVDLGSAFANLVSERYADTAGDRSSRRIRRLVESTYYLAPEALRRVARRLTYRRLETSLEELGEGASEYPVDATGWLLIELVKESLRRAARSLVRLSRWPAPYRSAALLTHDVEPRSYAYRRGLPRLLERASANRGGAAFGLVARMADSALPATADEGLRKFDVFCHGLTHRGESVHGREEVACDLRAARTVLERRLRRPVCGYRSPRLDRSPDLSWALDRQNFLYDSSYPDVDRENRHGFGTGVRVNLPYRPPIEGEPGRWRASTCLELPLTAPDCIQPLFWGDDVARLRRTVEEKAAFVREIGGLYVALVHAGVFGDEDARRREEHLDFVRGELSRPDTWLTTPSRLVEWWTAREALLVQVGNGTVTVRNDGDAPVAGVRVLVDGESGTMTFVLPELLPGEQNSFPMKADPESSISDGKWQMANGKW